MKRQYKLILIGWLIIVLFDALASVASRQFNVSYLYLGLFSCVIYCIFGFYGTKEINLKTGVLIAAYVGFFDSTVGWKISMLLKANTGNIKNDPTIATWTISIIFITGFAALCGLIGGWLGKAIKRGKSR